MVARSTMSLTALPNISLHLDTCCPPRERPVSPYAVVSEKRQSDRESTRIGGVTHIHQRGGRGSGRGRGKEREDRGRRERKREGENNGEERTVAVREREKSGEEKKEAGREGGKVGGREGEECTSEL